MKIASIKGFGIIAVLLFYFNRIALPFNLQFSIILCPFFFFYLAKINKTKTYFKVIGLFLLWSLLHYFSGAQVKSLVISTAVLVTIITFLFAFYYHYKSFQYEGTIKLISGLNVLLVLMSILIVMFVSLRPLTWYLIPITPNYPIIPRLKLFELEASHYSLALVPLFFYWILKLLKVFNRNEAFWFGSVLLSLILSFSIGVWGVLFIALVSVVVYNRKDLMKSKRTKNILLISVGALILITLTVLLTDNPLQFRLQNLIDGKDTSGRGRTYEAFLIAWETLKSKDATLFGIGLGQFKLIGKEVLLDFYKFEYNPGQIRLPNSMAETLVSFGLIGAFLKIALQLGLFFKFKVYQNLFQLSIFVAIFIYQFTGSFLFHTMEYILWVMAFVPQFEIFNKKVYFNK